MKLTKPEENFENMMKTINEANDALRDGFGPAHNSNNLFLAIPGTVEDNAPIGLRGKGYYALIVEIGENGAKPVDWYSWSPEPGFLSGFGGWHNYDSDEFVKANPWVKDVWDPLSKDKKIKAIVEKIYEEIL